MLYCALAGRAAETLLCRGRWFLCRFFRQAEVDCACKCQTNRRAGSNAAGGFELRRRCQRRRRPGCTARGIPAQTAAQPEQTVTQPAAKPVDDSPRAPAAQEPAKTGGKAFDRGADFANRLVQRQRTARALAVWYMADVYDSAPQKPDNSWENGEGRTFTSQSASNRLGLAGLIPAVYLTEDVLRN